MAAILTSEHERTRRLLSGFGQTDQVGVGISPGVSCRLKKKARAWSGKAKAQAEKFERDYPTLLLSLASAIRTGMDPIVALCEAKNLFDQQSLVARELSALDAEIQRGVGEQEAIRNFASSIDHPDIKLFRTVFLLARKEGSSLGDCLQRLARVTRQRQSFRRKIRSAIAMQKMSALGIGGCTLVIGFIQFSTNTKAFMQAFSHPVGSVMLGLGLALLASGLIWMLKMASAKLS